jgi:hypothetical protein
MKGIGSGLKSASSDSSPHLNNRSYLTGSITPDDVQILNHRSIIERQKATNEAIDGVVIDYFRRLKLNIEESLCTVNSLPQPLPFASPFA